MVNLNVNIPTPNITKYAIVGLDAASGQIMLRIYFGPGTNRHFDFWLQLSDTAGHTRGIIVNPSPTDGAVLINTGLDGVGIGVANSLTNAIAAYRAAATPAAGLKAVELLGVTDGWLPAAMAGT